MGVRSGERGLAVVLGLCLGGAVGCFDSHGRATDIAPEPTTPAPDGVEPGAPPDTEPGGTPPTPPEPPGDEPPDTLPDPDPPEAPDGPLAFIDEPVWIEAEPGYTFAGSHQIVGDMDGDGIDDFVLFALDARLVGIGTPMPSAAYVFYGRPDLPTTIDATAADAVLRGDRFPVVPGGLWAKRALGDVNGDGLADLAIVEADAVHFVLGSEQRLSGEHAVRDVASSWDVTAPVTADPFASAQQLQFAPAGDVNGDGLGDFALSTASSVQQTAQGSYTFSFATYLFTGRQGDWPTGAFDPSWATAELTVPAGSGGGCTYGTGADLDGDGRTELMVRVTDGALRVVPGTETLTGTVPVMEASVPFALHYSQLLGLPDLNGDGSDELVWRDSGGLPGVYVTYGGGEGALDAPLSLEPDLDVERVDETVGGIVVADVDGDGFQDLIVATSAVSSAPSPPPGGLYVVPARDTRVPGSLSLGDVYLVIEGDYDADDPAAIGRFGTSLDAGGDVTGDGIDDILAATVTAESSSSPYDATRVLLIPGGLEHLPAR